MSANPTPSSIGSETEELIYALLPNSIQVNDIVLTSATGVVPWGIRKFTDSDFSHAALCTRPGMLLEAVTVGVMRRSVIATYASQPEWIKVLRPKMALPLDSHGLGVADYAEALYGRGYSLRGAAASKYSIIGPAAAGPVFCSQVIAQAFADYGINLIPGKRPCDIYPGLLLKSPELLDVTTSCIRKVGARSSPEQHDQIVAAAEQELPGSEMSMNRRAFKAIRKELGAALPDSIHSLTDVSIWLSIEQNSDVVNGADEIILSVLEREGMFQWLDEFSVGATSLAQTLEFAATAAEQSMNEPMNADIESLLDDLTETAQLGQSSLAGRAATKNDYANLASKTGLKTFDRLRGVYQRQFDDAERIHQARARIIAALGKRPPT